MGVGREGRGIGTKNNFIFKKQGLSDRLYLDFV